MRDIPSMVDGSTSLSATYFNEIPGELENAITSSGQALTPANGSNPDLQQLAKTISIYASAGAYFSVGGTANAITLTAIGSKLAPPFYTDGQKVAFYTVTPNTGVATANVGNVGVKTIKRKDGSDVLENDINGFVEIQYVASSDYFVLLSSSLADTYKPNLISTNSKIEPITTGSEPTPDGTPRNYLVAYELSTGWFVGTELVNLTYVDGKYNADSGTLYRDIPYENGIEFYSASEFTASYADKNQLPITDGLSLSTSANPGFLRVTLDFAVVSDVFSAKVEIGSEATLNYVGDIGGSGQGATGGGSDKSFYLNDITANSNFTIPTGQGAYSTGGVDGFTIESGATITVGERWVVG